MSQKIYRKAAEHIKARQYSEARILLNAISDEPKAREWLIKLNQIKDKQQHVEKKTLTANAEPKYASNKAQMFFIFVIFGFVLLLGGFSFFSDQIDTILSDDSSKCSQKDIDAWWDDASPVVTEFLDQAEVATSTSRMSLSPVVLEMQQTHREYQGIKRPGCTPSYQSDIDSGMESAIDGFRMFLADNSSAQTFFTQANQSFLTAYFDLSDDNILPDSRMTTAYLIWGGDTPRQ